MENDNDQKINNKEESLKDLQQKIQASKFQDEINNTLNPVRKTFSVKSPLQTLRTLKGDMEQTVGAQKESVVSIVSKEVKSLEKEKIAEETNTNYISPKEVFVEKKSFNILGGSVALSIGSIMILVSLLILGVFYITKNNFSKEKVVVNDSLLTYTDKKETNILDKNISTVVKASVVSERVGYKAKVNSILYLKFLHNRDDIKSSDILKALVPNISDSILRFLVKDLYMVGVYSFDTNETFFIFKVEDFGPVYSSMLAFEPYMKESFRDFFPNIDKSTFSGENANQFKDEVLKNNDVRVLRNDKGEVVLIYGFIDRKNLIITANEKVYNGLVSKYINSQIVR